MSGKFRENQLRFIFSKLCSGFLVTDFIYMREVNMNGRKRKNTLCQCIRDLKKELTLEEIMLQCISNLKIWC